MKKIKMILVSALLMVGMISVPVLNAEEETTAKAGAYLESLTIKIDGQSVELAFNKETLSYEIEVEDTISEIVVEASVSDENSSATIANTCSTSTEITTLPMTCSITVTGKDEGNNEVVNVYSITVKEDTTGGSEGDGEITDPTIPTVPSDPATPEKTEEQKMNELIKAVEALIADSEELSDFVEVENYYKNTNTNKYTINFNYAAELEDGTIVRTSTSVDVAIADLENASKVVETLKTNLNNSYIEIIPTEENVVTKAALELMKLTNQYFYFFANSDRYIEWAIDGSKVTDEDTEINLNVFIGEEVNEELRKSVESLLVDKTKSLVLDFEHSGNLPEGTEVTIYVGDKFEDGTVLSLFYYNTKTKKLEEVSKKLEVRYGYVTLEIDHCSTYVLAQSTNNASTGATNVVLYSGVLLSALALIVVVLKKKVN